MASNGNVKQKSKDGNSGLLKFFREVKAEVKRITWPSKNEIKKASTAVVAFCLFYIVVIGGMDYIFKNLFDVIFKLK
ncbi:preprotein translocase subunit SecE [Clostridium polynesiense]|uniref:preprotein translocase subunit SecE n=1 Tax=Clostridium polynesiense TaxID=1325933 RepID=UPI00058C17FB|nr:preprotein translocase subunit SecE [Clostridium polynesiense]